MALLFMDGMDGYNSWQDASRRYAAVIWDVMNTGRFGVGKSIQHYGTHYNRVRLPANPAEVWICHARNWTEGFNALNANGTNGDCFAAVIASDNSTFQVSVSVDGANVKAWRGKPGQTLLGQASATVAARTWHWMEVRVKMDSAAGEVEVWIDDKQVMLLTGINTVAVSAEPYVAHASAESILVGRTLLDDIVILDTTGDANNARPGDCRIRPLYVTSDAGPNDGTPSSGTSHYPLVSEQVSDTGTYVALNFSAGQKKEEFGFQDLPSGSTVVKAVQVVAVLSKDDGGPAAGHSYVKSGSATATGPDTNLTSGLGQAILIAEKDPATNAAWLASAVNAATIGYEATA